MPAQNKELIFHIGLPKTGSTTLQTAILQNQDTLEKHSIFFPDVINPDDPRHIDIFNGFVNGNLNTLEQQLIKGINHQKIFISNESFSNEFYNIPTASWHSLDKLLKQYNRLVKIYLIDRNANDWLLSFYKQAIINQPHSRLDFYSTTLTLEQFKKHPYIAKLIDRKYLIRNIEQTLNTNVEVIFSHSIDIELQLKSIFNAIDFPTGNYAIANSSPPNELIEIIRHINKICSSPQEKTAWLSILLENYGECTKNRTLITLSKRAKTDWIKSVNLKNMPIGAACFTHNLPVNADKIQSLLDRIHQQPFPFN